MNTTYQPQTEIEGQLIVNYSKDYNCFQVAKDYNRFKVSNHLEDSPTIIEPVKIENILTPSFYSTFDFFLTDIILQQKL